ncbi:MAG: alcohol dehydrogenase catalytic domain-containing protein, partial [Anaerolineae bacterium]
MQLTQARPVDDEPLRLVNTAVPQPQPGQIRIRVSVCGVCHTDLQTVEGDLDLPTLPITPGHQVVGVVDAVGEEASRYQIGDRVGVAWLNWACG